MTKYVVMRGRQVRLEGGKVLNPGDEVPEEIAKLHPGKVGRKAEAVKPKAKAKAPKAKPEEGAE